MNELVTSFLDGKITDSQIVEIIRGPRHFDFRRELKRQVKEKDVKYYYYLITFTLKPGVKKAVDDIEKYIISQFGRPALHVVEAHIVKETTKNKVSHWHVAVKTNRFLAKNRFNYYEKMYGHVDVSKTRYNSIEESLNYINKVIPSTKIY